MKMREVSVKKKKKKARRKGYSLAPLFGLDNVCGRYDEGQ